MNPPRDLTINFVCTQPSLSGACKATKLLAEALVRRGHRVHILYLCDRPWPSFSQPRRLLRHLRTLWESGGNKAHHFESSTATLVPVHGTRVEARDVPEADISIGIMWETREWIESWPASKGLKAYIVTGDERLRGGDTARIEAVHRMPGLHLAVASWVQRLLEEHYGIEDSTLLPNGVEQDLLASPSRGRGTPPTVGLMYGRSPLKGAQVAFDAIRLAQKQVPALQTIAFGAASLHGTHHPPEPFEFHLRPEQEQLPMIYRRADCWLLPSTSEGFGMPGLEAAASRCPVIATRCGGPADYIREGISGHLVDVGDVPCMAQRLVDVLTCDAARWRSMSDAGHAIASKYTWDCSASILEQAIQARRERSQGSQVASPMAAQLEERPA